MLPTACIITQERGERQCVLTECSACWHWVIKDYAMNLEPAGHDVIVDGKSVEWKDQRHVMLNKPSGLVTASRDRHAKTVMDILPPLYTAMGCAPAGRLDKDTEGLLVITSDGQLAHRIISPTKEVGKVYLASVHGVLGPETERAFESGMHIADADGEFDAKPARLQILKKEDEYGVARVFVTEGKYHQVKRMFLACGCEVTALRRTAIGGLAMDERLSPGEWRELEEEELDRLFQPVQW